MRAEISGEKNNNKYSKQNKANLLKKYATYLLCASFCLGLTACASNKPKEETKPYQTLNPNSPEYLQAVIIQKASEATEAQNAYVTLVAEQQKSKEEQQIAFDTESIEIQDFIGKPQTLLKALAQRYGYEYKEIGQPRNLPTLNLDLKNDMPIDVLTQVSYQINQMADIIVDKDQKAIRLVYKQGR